MSTTYNMDMAGKDARKKSFKKWDKKNPMKVKDLVAAGLYYTENKDHVKCAFCGVTIGEWEKGDDALVEHRKLGPHCWFAQSADRQRSKSESEAHLSVRLLRKFRNQVATPSSPITIPGRQCKPCPEARGSPFDSYDPMSSPRSLPNWPSHYLTSVGSRDGDNGKPVQPPAKTMSPIEPPLVPSAPPLEEDSSAPQDSSRMRSSPHPDAYVSDLSNSDESDSNPQDKDLFNFEDEDTVTNDICGDMPPNNRQMDPWGQVLCKVCMDANVTILVRPCSHACMCNSCARKLYKCPMCRQRIRSKERIYL